MTARPALREIVTRWRWLILPLGGVLFALTVIFPQIGFLEWVLLVPALLVILSLTPDKSVKLSSA